MTKQLIHSGHIFFYCSFSVSKFWYLSFSEHSNKFLLFCSPDVVLELLSHNAMGNDLSPSVLPPTANQILKGYRKVLHL